MAMFTVPFVVFFALQAVGGDGPGEGEGEALWVSVLGSVLSVLGIVALFVRSAFAEPEDEEVLLPGELARVREERRRREQEQAEREDLPWVEEEDPVLQEPPATAEEDVLYSEFDALVDDLVGATKSWKEEGEEKKQQ